MCNGFFPLSAGEKLVLSATANKELPAFCRFIDILKNEDTDENYLFFFYRF